MNRNRPKETELSTTLNSTAHHVELSFRIAFLEFLLQHQSISFCNRTRALETKISKVAQLFCEKDAFYLSFQI